MEQKKPDYLKEITVNRQVANRLSRECRKIDAQVRELRRQIDEVDLLEGLTTFQKEVRKGKMEKDVQTLEREYLRKGELRNNVEAYNKHIYRYRNRGSKQG